MKIEFAPFDSIDQLEFKDRLGKIRATRGCSIRGGDEFRDRLQQLQQLLDQADNRETIQGLYLKDEYFAHVCDRCLELNGVESNWVNEQILVALLFHHENQPGLLVRLNQPDKPAKPGQKGATTHDLVACLWSHTQDLEKALKIAQDYPAKDVLGALEAKSQLEQEAQEKDDPKAIAKRKYKERQAQQRESEIESGGGLGGLFEAMKAIGS